MLSSDVPPGTIVVGVDDHRESERALLWALAQAALDDRPLTLVHAAGDPEDPDDAGAVSPVALARLERRRLVGERALRRAEMIVSTQAEVIGARVEVARVLSDEPLESVLEDLAGAASLVVMGLHASGAPRRREGDTLSGLVDRGPACPVVEAGRALAVGGEGVLVVVDGTIRSRATLGFAFHQARLLGLPLTVVAVPISLADDPDPDLDGLEIPGFEASVVQLMCSKAASSFPDIGLRLVTDPGEAGALLATARTRFHQLVLEAHALGIAAQQIFPGWARDEPSCVTIVLPRDESVEESQGLAASAYAGSRYADLQQVDELMRDLERFERTGRLGDEPLPTRNPWLDLRGWRSAPETG